MRNMGGRESVDGAQRQWCGANVVTDASYSAFGLFLAKPAMGNTLPLKILAQLLSIKNILLWRVEADRGEGVKDETQAFSYIQNL